MKHAAYDEKAGPGSPFRSATNFVAGTKERGVCVCVGGGEREKKVMKECRERTERDKNTFDKSKG